MKSGKPSATARWIVRLERFSDRFWYRPLIASLAGADLFVAFIPTDGVLITSVLLRPRRWFSLAVWVAAGSMAGAILLSALIHHYGDSMVTWIAGADGITSPTWLKTADFLNRWGWWALALIALGPTPQQPAVVLCALAKMPLPQIATAVFMGRIVKYLFFAWAATHAPKLFNKFGLGSVREEAEALARAAEEEKKRGGDVEPPPHLPKD